MKKISLQSKYSIVEHLTHTFIGRVRFNETDPLGIVWHGNYVDYFEEGREAFGRENGMCYLDIRDNGFVTPIVNVVVNYKKTLKYGEEYRVKTFLVQQRTAKITHLYEIYNEANELVCDGETTQVFVDLDGHMSLYEPEFYTEWKRKMKINNG